MPFLLLFIFSCGEPTIEEVTTKCTKKEMYKGQEISFLDAECVAGTKLPKLKQVLQTEHNLSQPLENKEFIVLNQWFIQCPPCIAEIGGLNKLKDEFENKALFLSVCTNSEKDLAEFLVNKPFNFTHIKQGREFIDKHLFSSFGFPTTYIFNKDFKIINILHGGKVDSTANDEIYKSVAAVLNK